MDVQDKIASNIIIRVFDGRQLRWSEYVGRCDATRGGGTGSRRFGLATWELGGLESVRGLRDKSNVEIVFGVCLSGWLAGHAQTDRQTHTQALTLSRLSLSFSLAVLSGGPSPPPVLLQLRLQFRLQLRPLTE